MSSALFVADWLKGENNRDYGLAPVPDSRDEKIAQLVRTWVGLNEEGRREVQSLLSRQQSFVLQTFAERMASSSVRERNPESLLLGLLALGIEGGKSDWRENYLVVPLHYDAAQRIGANPIPIFENVINLVGGTFAEYLRKFLQNPCPIEDMGYRIDPGSDGFRYQRTW
jgi:hypothetical protein